MNAFPSDAGDRTPGTHSDANSRLALDRTRLAYERTMLSWIRTAISLITFGFSVHQVFRIAAGAVPGEHHLSLSRHFGNVMVAMGLATLILAALEHRSSIRTVGLTYPPAAGFPAVERSSARLLAVLIGLLGILALVLMQAGS